MQLFLVKYYRGVKLFHLASTEGSSTKVEGLCFPRQVPKKKKLFHLTSTEVSSTKIEGLCFLGQVSKKEITFSLSFI